MKSLLRYIFSTACLHCRKDTGDVFRYFCSNCQSEFVLLTPEGRCKKCFLPLGECTFCIYGYPFTQFAAAFDYEGAPAFLIQHFKYHNKPYLALQIASFLVLQLLRLEWKIPDLIVPVPQSLSRSFSRGYNPAALIAEEMGKILGCTPINLLKRKSGDLPQTSLNQEQRKTLSSKSFSWRKLIDINEKVVLVVDDVRTTGTTLLHTGNLLKEGCPAALYAMTFCM